MKAKISEIFDSIQGEGIYQGEKQVFVRFFECNLNCAFCDTRLNFYKEMIVNEVLHKIGSFSNYHSVSLTGGEPLLQMDFLKELAYCLKDEGETLYLETNGTLPNNLNEVIEHIDIVAMDFKLPSSTQAGDFWNEHHQFLEIALEHGKEVFIKAVVGKNTDIEDILKSMEIIRSLKADVPFILQPQNPFEDILQSQLEFFEGICREQGVQVKVIPQMHKKIGIK